MRVELHEEDHSIKIVLRSGMMTSVDRGKDPEEDGWVHKAPAKKSAFDLNHAKETFMEEKKSFYEASTLGS